MKKSTFHKLQRLQLWEGNQHLFKTDLLDASALKNFKRKLNTKESSLVNTKEILKI